MNKLYIILSLLLFSNISFAKIKVLATTTNVASLVKLIGGDQVDVSSICLGTQDPHHLEAKPSYTLKASRTDILVDIGLGLEVGWLPLVVRGARNPAIHSGAKGRLTLGDYINPLEVPTGSVSRADGDVHPQGNPHFLFSFSRVKKLAVVVASKLAEFDASKADIFSQNAEIFKKHIDELSKNIPRGIKVVTQHKTFTYFLAETGARIVATIEPKPGIPPSAADILNVTHKLKLMKPNVILVENTFDDSAAKRIAREVKGVPVDVVPIGVYGEKGINNLYDLYKRLIKALVRK